MTNKQPQHLETNNWTKYTGGYDASWEDAVMHQWDHQGIGELNKEVYPTTKVAFPEELWNRTSQGKLGLEVARAAILLHMVAQGHMIKDIQIEMEEFISRVQLAIKQKVRDQMIANIICNVIDSILDLNDEVLKKKWKLQSISGFDAQRIVQNSNQINKNELAKRFQRCHYGEQIPALSHVQKQEICEDAIDMLYKETGGRCWIDILCEDDFNPELCRMQYLNQDVHVYDEMLFNTEDIPSLQVAIALSEWSHRGWVAQEMALAGRLFILTRGGVVQLVYSRVRTASIQAAGIFDVTKYGVLSGIIAIPGFIDIAYTEAWSVMWKLVGSVWTYDKDIYVAYNILHVTQYTSLKDIMPIGNMVAMLFGTGTPNNINGWCWAKVCNNHTSYIGDNEEFIQALISKIEILDNGFLSLKGVYIDIQGSVNGEENIYEQIVPLGIDDIAIRMKASEKGGIWHVHNKEIIYMSALKINIDDSTWKYYEQVGFAGEEPTVGLLNAQAVIKNYINTAPANPIVITK